MAVQAQYPPNVLLLNRSEQDLKEMEYSQAPQQGFLDQSAAFFSSGAANGKSRKRGREAPAPAPAPQQSHQPISLFSLQPTSVPSPTFINLAQLQNQTPPLVSTGLRLAFDDQNQNQNQSNPHLSSSLLSTVLSKELAVQISQQKQEIDQFLVLQGEQLRRSLAERWQRQHRMLLGAAEESAVRRLREKEAEVEQAARRGAELEDRLTRLRAESMAWQAKAIAEQAAATSLHNQLQYAAAAAAATSQCRGDECGESPEAEDAESAHVDPDRAERERACRACRGRPASVVLLPCRHLCLCSTCDDAGGVACPVCRCVRTGSVQVFLS